MPGARDYHGSLVAFEGPSDTISTQLRLLPTSAQILILPAVQNYVRPAGPDHEQQQQHEEFSARSYIRRVHDAAVVRNETALSFLRDPPPPSSASKRLVFMNGGTASAQALCIRAIAQHDTDGDLALAEATFRDLIRAGLGGLDREDGSGSGSGSGAAVGLAPAYEEPQDPITRAMRAADELDRLTAALQPSSWLDLSTVAARTRPRSLSLPLYGFADHFGDTVPFYVFGAENGGNHGGDNEDEDGDEDEEDDDEPGESDDFGLVWQRLRAPRADVDGRVGRRGRRRRPEEDEMVLSRVPSCVGEAYRPRPLSILSNLGSEPRPSPLSDVFTIPDSVVYGKASLIELPPSSRPRAKRALSLDRITPPGGAKYRDVRVIVRPRDDIDETRGTRGGGTTDTGRPTPLRLRGQPARSSTQGQPGPLIRAHVPARASYVDRGTDAEDLTTVESFFEPVFPLVEDLVIYFKDDAPDSLLRSMILAFRQGIYPITAPLAAPSESDDHPHRHRHAPQTPASSHYSESPGLALSCQDEHELEEAGGGIEAGHVGPEVDDNPTEPGRQPSMMQLLEPDDYDPFSYHEHSGWPMPRRKMKILPPLIGTTAATTLAAMSGAMPKPVATAPAAPFLSPTAPPSLSPTAPPTPAQTPPPPNLLSETEELFHEFDIGGSPTAMQTQNALRSVLGIYFPSSPGGGGKPDGGCYYHQFSVPLLLPELGGLWMPIFREPESGSASGRRKAANNGKVDMILAIGSQGGVRKEFLAGIVTRLEQLGTKTSGAKRSGRLDFRYLIANAMQAFTTQPLANQAHDNPFTNSYLLATLIISPLETYLAAHSEVRFLLLEFPPEHLSTVLALQRLVGADVVKVSQVVDSNAKQPLPFNHLRGGSICAGSSAGSSSSSSSTTSSSSPSISAAGSSAASRSQSGVNGSSGRSLLLPPPAPASPASEKLKISDTNYLLTASASEAEISTFISTIRKILIDISSFYAPERGAGGRSDGGGPAKLPIPSPSPSSAKRSKKEQLSVKRSRSALAGGFSPFPRVPSGPHSPPLSPPLSGGRFQNGHSQPQPLPPTPSPFPAFVPTAHSGPLPDRPSPPIMIPARSASLMDETLTIRSGRSGVRRRGSRAQSQRNADGGESDDMDNDASLAAAMDSDWDSDPMDQEERRLMPIFMKRPQLPKEVNRKARKFLGLE